MWTPWAGRGKSEGGTTIIEHSSEGTNEPRSLLGSFPGSVTGIEFYEAGPASDRDYEADLEHGPPVGCVAQALNIRENRERMVRQGDQEDNMENSREGTTQDEENLEIERALAVFENFDFCLEGEEGTSRIQHSSDATNEPRSLPGSYPGSVTGIELKSLPGSCPGSVRGIGFRSLPGSYPGSVTGIEFDVEAGPVSDRDSEADPDPGTPVDWEAQALNIRERLLQRNQENVSEDKKPRTPSPDYDVIDYGIPSSTPETNSVRGILKKQANTYELEKYRRNAMIIFNHKDFLAGMNKSRQGTMQDEVKLKATFERFGFEVETHLDLPKKSLLQTLRTFCSKDFTHYGCVCVAILTHGSKHGYLRAYDTRYSEHEVIECFNVHRNPSLLGKPIIILIQACRGDEPATAVNPGTPKLADDIEMDNDDHYNFPTESDMLIFHSSYVGRASARELLKGSWFIQILCEQIMLLAAAEDFESICRVVKKEIALEKEHNMILNCQPVILKQMPVVTSTLLRRLYLRKYEGCEEDDDDSTEALKDELICDADREKMAAACGCDAYFEYIKKCLTLYIRENPRDEVAISILKIAGNVEKSGNKYIQMDMVNLVRNYLSKNANRFKFSEAVYLGQPCRCQTSREVKYLCCSVC